MFHPDIFVETINDFKFYKISMILNWLQFNFIFWKGIFKCFNKLDGIKEEST